MKTPDCRGYRTGFHTEAGFYVPQNRLLCTVSGIFFTAKSVQISDTHVGYTDYPKRWMRENKR